LITAGVAIAACAVVAGALFSALDHASHGSASHDVSEGPPPNYAGNPLALSLPVADTAAASPSLPFKPVLPLETTPTNMWVTDPAQTPALSRQIVADFKTPTDGLYQITEQPTAWTVSSLQTVVDQCTTCTTQKIVNVDGVQVAVLATPDMGLGAYWVRGDGTVLTSVAGPYDTFSEQSALSIAGNIIAQSG
jgi:hypothetical protein